jgi:hypothetical protein
MARKGKIDDPERLAQLAEARKKSLETRRRNAARKKAKKQEEEEKAKKYDKLIEEQEEKQVNLDDPIQARAASTIPIKKEKDENVVHHPSQSRFGEKPLVEIPIGDDDDLILQHPSDQIPEEQKPEIKKPVVKKPEPEEEDEESEPDLFKSEEEYFTDDTIESEDEPQKVVKKKKRRKSKRKVKRVKYYSSSSSDSEGEIIIRRKKPKKNVLYYEDLEEYLKFKNKETEKFVEPPVAQQISVQEKEDEIFRRRLEEARKSLFSI